MSCLAEISTRVLSFIEQLGAAQSIFKQDSHFPFKRMVIEALRACKARPILIYSGLKTFAIIQTKDLPKRCLSRLVEGWCISRLHTAVVAWLHVCFLSYEFCVNCRAYSSLKVVSQKHSFFSLDYFMAPQKFAAKALTENKNSRRVLDSQY